MATWVTPSSASQSPSASNWLVMVPKVRVCCCTFPLAARRRTQTTTVFLWTSRPAHEGYTRSIGDLPETLLGKTARDRAICSACSPTVGGDRFGYAALSGPD